MVVLSNTEATFEAQFMEKLNNIEVELKKTLLIKNRSCEAILFRSQALLFANVCSLQISSREW